jgi:membrane fusion protein (multidrug efflux system)
MRAAARGDRMKAQGYLSDRELEDLQLKQRQAEVAYDEARLALSRTQITAPFAGRVASRTVQLGETVTAGRECFRVVNANPLLARLYLPERELANIRVGQTATAMLESAPGRPWAARVTLVNPVVDEAHGTFKVTLEVPNPRGEIRPGAFARIRIQAGHVADALLVPRRGVLSEDGDTFVFVARGDSAVRVPIRLGVEDRDTVQVVQGLAAGDRVVTVGHGGLKQGARIKAATL